MVKRKESRAGMVVQRNSRTRARLVLDGGEMKRAEDQCRD